MQNLRARPYDPANGRFIGLDPFAGNMQDPQSLHKYAYVHGDPIGGVDPTGLFSLASSMAGSTIGAQLNSTTAEGGNVVLDSLHRKKLAWDTIGFTLVSSFLPFAAVIGDEVFRTLGPYAKEALAAMPWLQSSISSIQNLPSSLVAQLYLNKEARRAIFKVRMFAEHGTAIFGKWSHHLIPLEVIDDFQDIMARASKGGFDSNGAENGMLLKGTGKKFSTELFDEGFRHFNNHPAYSGEVRSRLAVLEASLSGASDKDVAQAIKDFVQQLANEIGTELLIVS